MEALGRPVGSSKGVLGEIPWRSQERVLEAIPGEVECWQVFRKLTFVLLIPFSAACWMSQPMSNGGVPAKSEHSVATECRKSKLSLPI